MTSPRPAVLAACLSAAFAAAIGGALVTTANSRYDGDLPSSRAATETVARRYLDAAVDRRCDITRALTMSSTWSWCRSPALQDYSAVSGSFTVPAAAGAPRLRCVEMSITVRDGSSALGSGIHGWSMCFTSSEQGWRLWDQGVTSG